MRICVIGDAMLDIYIYGKVFRVNPEYPSLILTLNDFLEKKAKFEIGGAGNVFENIVNLGLEACFISRIGKDVFGKKLKNMLSEVSKSVHLFEEKNLPTICKMRFVDESSNAILLRVDIEKTEEFGRINEIKNFLEDIDIFVISDYNKGMITEELVNLMKSSNAKIVVDAKPKNKEFYRDVFLIKVNESEAREYAEKDLKNDVKLCKHLTNQYNANFVITKKDGFIFGKKGKNVEVLKFEYKTKAIAKSVAGAGDVFLSGIVYGLANNYSLYEACKIGYFLAKSSVTKEGTCKISREDARKIATQLQHK